MAAAIARFKLLHEKGRSLERLYVAHLDKGIYELRWKSLNINYRILYFWDEDKAVILTNGFTKQKSRVPESEIALAESRRAEYLKMNG